MKKRTLKLISAFLALTMILSMLLCAIPVSAATTISSKSAKEKLDAFIAKHPSGSQWNDSFDGGIQCYGFAKLVTYNLFGKYSSSRYRSWTYAGVSTSGMKALGSITSYSSTNVKNLLAKATCGDVLQFDEPKMHSMIIYSVNKDDVTVYDCNWDNKCGIRLKAVSFGTWSGRNSAKLTLLRSENYSPTLKKSLNVQYNANGASIDCNKYIVDSGAGLNLRSEASTSGKQLCVIPDGKQITVSETKTAGGYTWGKTTYDSKTGWCALAKGTEAWAYKRYYLSSNNVYLTDGKKVLSQAWTCGETKTDGLYNYTTFGLKRPGYSFVGWCANADGSGTIFGQDDSSLKAEDICADVKTKDCTVTLYAIWKENVKTVTGISIVTNPAKTTYYVGDSFDPSMMLIMVRYSDGSDASISSLTSPELYFDYDFSVAGTTDVEVVYYDKSLFISVQVKEPRIEVDRAWSVSEGGKIKLNVTTDPANVPIEFLSFDPQIAVVDEGGYITGLINGTTYITAMFDYNGETYADTCELIVGTGIFEEPSVNPSRVIITPDNFEFKKGDTFSVEFYAEFCSNVYSGDFGFEYNGDLIKATSFRFGDMLSTAQKDCNIEKSGIVELSFDSTQAIANNGILLTVNFETLQESGETMIWAPDMEIRDIEHQWLPIEGYGCRISISDLEPLDENAPQIAVESKRVTAGTEFTVTVQVKNNPGFMIVSLTPNYPRELTLVGVKNGGLFSSLTQDRQIVLDESADVTADGTLFTLTFRTDSSVATGEYPVSFTVQGCTDNDENDVELAVVPGTIKIISFVYGDATGDSVIDTKDVVRLRKYLAAYDYETGTSSVDINLGGDATGDSVIDTKDVVRLRKYLAAYNYETGTSSVALGI